MAVAPFDTQQAKKHQQAWADHLGVPVRTTNSIGMTLVLIPPGESDMGSSQEEVERLLSDGTFGRMFTAWDVRCTTCSPGGPRSAGQGMRVRSPKCTPTSTSRFRRSGNTATLCPTNS